MTAILYAVALSYGAMWMSHETSDSQLLTNELLTAFQRQKANISRFTGIVTTEMAGNVMGRFDFKNSTTFMYNGVRRRLVTTHVDEGGATISESAFIINERYAAELVRPGPGQLWRMTDYLVFPTTRPLPFVEVREQQLADALPGLLTGHFYSGGVTTLDAGSQHGSRITSISEEGDGAERLIIAEITLPRSPVLGSMSGIQFTVHFSPSRDMSVVKQSYRYEAGQRTTTHSTITVEQWQGSIPAVRRMRHEYYDADGKLVNERDVIGKTTVVESAILPAADFTLSAFGLEEPFGVEWPRPTPWWLYLAGGTVFFFVLALLFGAAIRRFNARVAG